MIELDADSARQWLSDRLGFEPDSVVPLTGGVSSAVLLASCGERRVVVKQSLPQLLVAAEWLCDRRRALLEARALRLLGPVLPEGAIPELLAEDPAHFTFAMSAAAPAAESWKARLMRGACEVSVARQAGRILSALVEGTAGRFEGEFDDGSIFDNLRLEAYYRYTAARHPDLSPFFAELIADCVGRRFCLVHGDWSPKNILTDGTATMAIDWECVHFGNPAFDAAFLLNHLLLKSFYLPERSDAFAELAGAFWEELRGAVPAWFHGSALRHWPGLLLARMDGKSPVEYVTDAALKDRIRKFARDLIARPPASVGEAFERRMLWP